MPPLIIDQAVEVQITKMQLVDTTNVPWEQITDFRQDRVSRSMLRDMRLLFAKDLTGKSPAYVEDYIESRLENYDLARRKHGFDTFESSAQLILRSKSLFALGAAAAAGAYTGNWDIAAGAVAGSAAIETSRLALNVVKSRRDFIFWSRQADLGYIFAARRALEH